MFLNPLFESPEHHSTHPPLGTNSLSKEKGYFVKSKQVTFLNPLCESPEPAPRTHLSIQSPVQKKKVTFSELKREHSQIAKEKGIKTAKEYLAA